jgi:transcriptional regulator with XRE-family HTH domain
MNYHELEISIGDRICFYRKNKKLSQIELAKKTEISNTAISNFEKGRQKPSLITVARLAQALEVSIDDLFFGNINERFITSAEDEAAVIVNSICKLWETGVLKIWQGEEFQSTINTYIPDGSYINMEKYQKEIVRLLKGLRDFYAHKEYYSDAHAYLNALKESVINEIRNEMAKEKK